VGDTLTVAETAKLLFVSRPYVLKLIADGKLPATVGADGTRAVDKLAAEAYRAQQQERSRKALEELAQLSQELELYESTSVSRGGLLLFLDFDGVVHPESVYWHASACEPSLEDAPGHTLFEHCTLLEKVLLPYPDVQIVLSTSWVRVYRGDVSTVVRRLTPGLQTRVIGATYHAGMDAAAFEREPRGMQVWQDVLRRRPAAWVALDDDYVDWPTHCVQHLVRTHPVLGITPPTVLAALREKLAAMHGG
jgi:excisionase family DNA binding protein